MKILASSDFHGQLPEVDTPFDLFLICGDVCPSWNHGFLYQYHWLKNTFITWVNELPFKDAFSKVVMIWGNHDFFGEGCTKDDIKAIEQSCHGRLKILTNSRYEHEFMTDDGLDSLIIFGTPYCTLFGNWAFMRNDLTLDEKFSEIPDDTDIILSHDAPKMNGLGDITEGQWGGVHGNEILAKHIKRVQPKMAFCGHFHSGNHELTNVDGIWMANVSLLNERYTVAHHILEINYDENTREVKN